MLPSLPQNPFAYPGGAAGFNPAHPAAAGIRVSAVAGLNGTLRKVFTPGIISPTTSFGNITGTIATKASPIGSVLAATTTAGNFISVSGNAEGSIVGPPSITLGAIFTFKGTATGLYFGWGGPGIVNNVLGNYLSNPIFVTNSSNLIASNITLTVGHSYFVGVSYLSATRINWVVRDLTTGQIFTETDTTSVVSQPLSGAYYFGGYTSASGYGSQADLAAISYSINNFLSLQQLVEWAQAPLDFWYPPTQRALLASGLKVPPSGNIWNLTGNLGGASQYG